MRWTPPPPSPVDRTCRSSWETKGHLTSDCHSLPGVRAFSATVLAGPNVLPEAGGKRVQKPGPPSQDGPCYRTLSHKFQVLKTLTSPWGIEKALPLSWFICGSWGSPHTSCSVGNTMGKLRMLWVGRETERYQKESGRRLSLSICWGTG